jgi:hypothetical protein
MVAPVWRKPVLALILFGALLLVPDPLLSQGVTTAALNGLVSSEQGPPIPLANVLAVHLPSGTQYRAVARAGGAYTIPNMRIGGPYRVSVTYIGYEPRTVENVFLSLGQSLRLDLRLKPQAVQLAGLEVTAVPDEVLNAGRTGATTFIDPTKVALLPSIKRSTRDLIRLDPRNDGNFSFAGRNWLYNNISLDGSYFNNPYGLDDPAPGGQSSAEPVPYDAVEQVQVSIAPFDVREGGFTGANINTVTKSGTNSFRTSLYSFYRNDKLEGNTVRGSPVVANPDLKYLQSGFAVSGPLQRNKLFFYLNAELERTDDPGTNFAAFHGSTGFGISRVRSDTMDLIRQRMIDQYNYDPGVYEGYKFNTDNNKVLAKLDWNLNASNSLSFRWNYHDAKREQGPHPFVLSVNNTGRGPNSSSLPFQKSGYAINNKLNSFALELNSRSTRFANRFFASYNRFRDFRTPFSEDFPTIEIGQGGVTYTTLGEEPFSINNVLDQDVYQVTNNFSVFRGRHTLTFGANFEQFKFFNSFNIFRHGLFQLPYDFLPFLHLGGATFPSLQAFFDATAPGPDRIDFRSFIGSGPYKGENISVGQFSLYAQDELPASARLNLTFGARVDLPKYFTHPVDNAYSRGLTALDEHRDPEVVDQSKLPGTKVLFSPRIGFNWNAVGQRQTQIRGGTGIFTGRVPFVWVGNVISNPGANPALPPGPGAPEIVTHPNTILKQSFDLNAMDPNFKFPQSWTTDLAIDQRLPGNALGTLEVIYGKDLHSVFMRNANLRAPVRTLPDGRPYFGGAGNNELNNLNGGAIFVIDNKNQGHSLNVTAQLRKEFGSALNTSLAYSFTDAKNNLKSTEIASVLWQNQPVQGDPNNPELSWSEFGQRHRIVGTATWAHSWSERFKTSVGMFLEIAQGNRFAGAGGNRYSFIYAGDVNGDGQGGNDLIYIPRDAGDIILLPTSSASVAQQSAALEAFIQQDSYLRSHRGQIAERFGEVNPWYSNIDLRVLQDLSFGPARRHNFQLSIDVLNLANLLNSSWGVRKVASPAATSPLQLDLDHPFDASGAPQFHFVGPAKTFIDDPSLFSRWRAQIGLRYFLY